MERKNFMLSGPIRVNSGFRCPEVNEGVGGVGASKHLSGEAMDIHMRRGREKWVMRERARALLGRMPGDEAHPLRPRPDTQ